LRAMIDLSRQSFEMGYEASCAGRPCIVALNVEINQLLSQHQGENERDVRMLIMRGFVNGVRKHTDELFRY
jgi:hypothetical protein